MGIEHYCPTCFGQGVITSNGIIPGGKCGTCNGTGFVTDRQFKEIQKAREDDGDEKLEDSREGGS